MARPLPGLEVVSVRGSHRHWREAHDSFTVAMLHRDKKRVVADWHTRARSVSTEGGGNHGDRARGYACHAAAQAGSGSGRLDVVRFSPSLVASALLDMDAPASFHFKAPAAIDAPTFEALQSLVGATATGDALDVECAAARALRVLISRLAESAPHGVGPLNPVRDFRLRKVRDYLCAHLDRRPTLAELEAVSGLSRYHLCGIFPGRIRHVARSLRQCPALGGSRSAAEAWRAHQDDRRCAGLRGRIVFFSSFQATLRRGAGRVARAFARQ